jgi:RNA polymerase sigma factor (sigma-70 family)
MMNRHGTNHALTSSKISLAFWFFWRWVRSSSLYETVFATVFEERIMEPSDEMLVLACRRGDAAAWEQLIARYERLIYTIAYRCVPDEEEAVDVFQHVFAQLVEHLDEIEEPARIRTWLTKTARYEAWRLQRRARVLGTIVSTDDEHRIVPDKEPLPDEVLLRLEEEHELRLALAALDERCCRLLIAMFFDPDPPPYAQIAAEFGMTEGSIGPTRGRCLQKLRALLENRKF